MTPKLIRPVKGGRGRRQRLVSAGRLCDHCMAVKPLDLFMLSQGLATCVLSPSQSLVGSERLSLLMALFLQEAALSREGLPRCRGCPLSLEALEPPVSSLPRDSSCEHYRSCGQGGRRIGDQESRGSGGFTGEKRRDIVGAVSCYALGSIHCDLWHLPFPSPTCRPEPG